MIKQKAARLSDTDEIMWAAYEKAWAEFIRTPTDGAGNNQLAIARATVEAIEFAMSEGRRADMTTVQDIIEYHKRLDSTASDHSA